jgi:hypothetical protein
VADVEVETRYAATAAATVAAAAVAVEVIPDDEEYN